jgi:hypothetical protein
MHIEFGGRGHITNTMGRPAHDHNSVDHVDQAGIATKSRRYPGQGAEAQERDFPRIRFQAIRDQFVAGHHVLPTYRLQLDIAEPIRSVEVRTIRYRRIFRVAGGPESRVTGRVKQFDDGLKILGASRGIDGA